MKLALNHLAPLVGIAPHIDMPWHDADLDRDCVTDGRCLLVWAGHAFATPGPDVAILLKPPAVTPIIEPAPELGVTTLGALRRWARWPGLGGCCDCEGELVARCNGCGSRFEALWPARFCGVTIDRLRLHRWLRPLADDLGDTAVHVLHGGGREEAVKLVSKLWTLAIMPVRDDGPDDMVGPAFELAEGQS
jgi:hypothetical protein